MLRITQKVGFFFWGGGGEGASYVTGPSHQLIQQYESNEYKEFVNKTSVVTI